MSAQSIPLQAMLGRCRDGQALVTLESQPFNGMEIRPSDLRELSQRLSALADMATRLPTGGKHWRPSKVCMGPTPEPRPELPNTGAPESVDLAFRKTVAEDRRMRILNCLLQHAPLGVANETVLEKALSATGHMCAEHVLRDDLIQLQDTLCVGVTKGTVWVVELLQRGRDVLRAQTAAGGGG